MIHLLLIIEFVFLKRTYGKKYERRRNANLNQNQTKLNQSLLLLKLTPFFGFINSIGNKEMYGIV